MNIDEAEAKYRRTVRRAAESAQRVRTSLACLTIEITTPAAETMLDRGGQDFPPTWRLLGREGYEGY